MTTRINVRQFAEGSFGTAKPPGKRFAKSSHNNLPRATKTSDHLRKHRHRTTRMRCHGPSIRPLRTGGARCPNGHRKPGQRPRSAPGSSPRLTAAGQMSHCLCGHQLTTNDADGPGSSRRIRRAPPIPADRRSTRPRRRPAAGSPGPASAPAPRRRRGSPARWRPGSWRWRPAPARG